mmetsp:Transcript_23302/g.56506  ORF Transcript_23302/g.56506 Transcript_23302/m.56506 type:complete len:142 (-) Transcript_23302:639-1064(-)
MQAPQLCNPFAGDQSPRGRHGSDQSCRAAVQDRLIDKREKTEEVVEGTAAAANGENINRESVLGTEETAVVATEVPVPTVRERKIASGTAVTKDGVEEMEETATGTVAVTMERKEKFGPGEDGGRRTPKMIAAMHLHLPGP